MTNNKFNLGGGTYESPSVDVFNVVSEGVFCTSTDFATGESGIEEWLPDNESLDF